KRRASRIRVGDRSGGNRSAEGVGTEIRVGLRGAGVHRRAGDQASEGDAMELVLLLAIDEEEGLVLLNWSTDGTTKLVEIELFRRGGEEALGIQIRIAEKLE